MITKAIRLKSCVLPRKRYHEKSCAWNIHSLEFRSQNLELTYEIKLTWNHLLCYIQTKYLMLSKSSVLIKKLCHFSDSSNFLHTWCDGTAERFNSSASDLLITATDLQWYCSVDKPNYTHFFFFNANFPAK